MSPIPNKVQLAATWVTALLLALPALSATTSAQDAPAGADPLRAEQATEVLAQGRRRRGRHKRDRGKKKDERYGWLQIFSNYEALITVDGQPYPRRSEYGMKLDAGKRHDVVVKLGDKEKSYVVVVKPRELRTLMVDLTGYNTPPSPSRSPTRSTPRASSRKDDDDDENSGKLTVYSKPRGEVYVDGSGLGVSTPMINRELDIGRHEVQVKWEDGDLSETKTIRIRKGSKLKLFFRDRSNKVGRK